MTAGTYNSEQLQDAQRQAAFKRIRQISGRMIAYGLMLFLGFVFLFPIIFMVVAAFKPNDRVIADLASIQAFLPDLSTLTLANIEDVFDRVPFGQYSFNSLFLTLVTVITGLFINSMAAFTLSRLRWVGRTVVLSIIISLIIIPLEAIAVPLLMEVNQISGVMNIIVMLILVTVNLLLWIALWEGLDPLLSRLAFLQGGSPLIHNGIKAILVFLISLPFEVLVYFIVQQTIDGGTWLDSFHVQIIPFIAEPFSIFLFYQFFIGIPKDFDEAAVVDGASTFRIYWQIIVPLSRPVFATVAILKFLQFWSFYMWPLMVTRSETYRPLMVGMDFFQTQAPIRWGSIMAYAALVTVPVLIVFLLFQKWFVQSVSSSGVKG